MPVLVVADHDNSALAPITFNTVTAAAEITADVHVLVAGNNSAGVAEAASMISGVAKVLHAEGAAYEHQLAEALAPVVIAQGKNYSHILFPSNTTGKNVAPRVAALLDVAQISDIVEVVSDNTFVRPIYAGNAIATVQSSDPVKVITVRGTAFAAAETQDVSGIVESVETAENPSISAFVGDELTKSERPELTAARVIISGGRGMQSGENFEMIEKIADKLGAAVGASRAAVDAGYKPNDYQVGQTGKVVAPELYIAVGISGAIQHLAGMKDSKVIVAINKDEEAPIFSVADYGIVGDLFKIIPELDEELEQQEIKPR
ncbi:MAG: Electron transfer flavoprotein subunit alpha [Alphaproteobacteria bacterium MarineAlpha11_Bin1]|nr:MAG: Electron transfer flavoprotein subunit alpha [Alphaproteobacteria bacterium MarineAlpha11_Bin1]|tara:strand:- start:8368 stop:9321 length:954 start_codon:yes stop_codon:yes gene_type:complete